MDYKLSDLIDVEKSRSLLESFCEAVGIASAIIDLEGNVLIGVTGSTNPRANDALRATPNLPTSCARAGNFLYTGAGTV